METQLWAVGLVVFGCVISAFGALYLKLGSASISFNLKSFLFNRKLMLGVFLYGLSAVFFIAGLKGGELSVLYPVVSTGYIWICLLSARYLKEEMTRLKWLGILFIIIGVSLIGYGS